MSGWMWIGRGRLGSWRRLTGRTLSTLPPPSYTSCLLSPFPALATNYSVLPIHHDYPLRPLRLLVYCSPITYETNHDDD